MRQSKSDRLARQRERSRLNRLRKREGRIPGRDDIARVALRWLLVSATSFGDDRKLFKLEGHILDELIRQGFDPRASEDALDDLVRKYSIER